MAKSKALTGPDMEFREASTILYIITVVKCMIVELYRNGQRLDRDVALSAAPVGGELTVFDSDSAYENASGRPLRRAELFEVTPGCNRPVLRPLFEPSIIRMKLGKGGFVLRGWQVDAKRIDAGHEIKEVIQEWWVRT